LKSVVRTPARLLGLALALAPWFAWAGPSLHVEETLELSAPPAQVWATVGEFGSLSWHPVVAHTQVNSSTPNQPGSERTVTVKDGAQIVEALQAYDASQYTLTYRIVRSPLPVTGYVSTLRVLPSASGTKVVWSSDFERDASAPNLNDAQAREVIAGIYKAGFDGLRAVFPSH